MHNISVFKKLDRCSNRHSWKGNSLFWPISNWASKVGGGKLIAYFFPLTWKFDGDSKSDIVLSPNDCQNHKSPISLFLDRFEYFFPLWFGNSMGILNPILYFTSLKWICKKEDNEHENKGYKLKYPLCYIFQLFQIWQYSSILK